MRRLSLSAGADADLAGIAQHSEQTWGSTRKKLYMAAIGRRLRLLRIRPFVGAARDDLAPGYRSLRCAVHVIFYRVSAEQIRVLRILHVKMDPHLHLLRSSDVDP
jgi:toxin ParE1/3/4